MVPGNPTPNALNSQVPAWPHASPKLLCLQWGLHTPPSNQMDGPARTMVSEQTHSSSAGSIWAWLMDAYKLAVRKSELSHSSL